MHPYPDFAYLEIDAETNENRWFSSKGMGVGYVHEDRVAEDIEAAVKAEREACAKIAADRAAVCRSAYDAGDRSEVHPLNEALHIAQLIRNR